jgi:predicted O-methyltransferase YrrM
MDPRIKNGIDKLAAEFEQEEIELQRTGAEMSFETAALQAGPEAAGFLNMLIRLLGARSIVEIGTSYGYTALWMGEAARDTGGRVIGIEYYAAKCTRARESIDLAGLSDIVIVRQGDALQIVRELEGPIDLAFIDAAKPDYIVYFDVLLPKLRAGGCIVADNIILPERAREAARAYQAHVRANPSVRSMELTIGDGLEMTVKIA